MTDEESGGDSHPPGPNCRPKIASTSPKRRRASRGEGRTDDPVRMYLREMGAVELLSREGEIAIAKRIEAGRDTMIMGLCESPITFHAIITWSEALNNGEMQLREILDLDAMLSKEPPVDKMEEGAEDDDDGEISEATAGPTIRRGRRSGRRGGRSRRGRRRRRAQGPQARGGRGRRDNTMSLAQMEAALKPDALERFARITDLFKKFEKLQAERVEVLGAGRSFPQGQGKQIRRTARSS